MVHDYKTFLDKLILEAFRSKAKPNFILASLVEASLIGNTRVHT